MKFGYTLFENISCYADCSNARQKIRLVGETLKGIVFIPKGRRDLIPPEATGCRFEEVTRPIGIVALMRFLRDRHKELSGFGYAVSNEVSFLQSLILSLFSGVPIVLFCWDPPGMTVHNRADIVSRLRCKVLDVLMGLAVRCSRGMVLNLHPGFLEGRFSDGVRRKIFTFPNGTTIQENLSFANSAKRVQKRFAVACRVNELKGCWDVANFFIKLFQRDREVSLVWVGGGDVNKVRQYLIDNDVPADQIIMTDNVEREEGLKHIATASWAINMYPDVPSLRWNYILKAPEFLSFGLPVVTVDAPGVCEYIDDGVNGLVIEPGHLEAAVDKVLSVMNNAARYEQMRSAARERSLRYDWNLINRSIADRISALLEDRP